MDWKGRWIVWQMTWIKKGRLLKGYEQFSLFKKLPDNLFSVFQVAYKDSHGGNGMHDLQIFFLCLGFVVL